MALQNPTIRFFKKYDLRFVFVGSLIVSVILLQFDKTKDYGLNLFSEITGVALTVFIINKMLERRDRQKRIPIDQRILREIQSITASYFSIWKHLVWQFLPAEEVKSGEDLHRIYPRLISLANIHQQFEMVSIHDPESWKLFFHNKSIKDCFHNYYETLTTDLKAFVSDYKMYLEPELLDYLLTIVDSQYFKAIHMMSQEGTEKVLIEWKQDPNKLESYLAVDDLCHINYFIELVKYSQRLQSTISRFSDTPGELYQIDRYFIHPLKNLS